MNITGKNLLQNCHYICLMCITNKTAILFLWHAITAIWYITKRLGSTKKNPMLTIIFSFIPMFCDTDSDYDTCNYHNLWK